MSNPAIEKAIEQAGSAAELSRVLGMSQQALWNAKNRGYFYPDKAKLVHEIYGIDYASLINPRLARSLPN